MDKEGPTLEHLLHRIAAVPSEFHSEPKIAGKGEIHVPAVVRDLLAMRGLPIDISCLSAFAGRDAKADRNRLAIALLICWVLADRDLPIDAGQVNAVLGLMRDDATQ
jgi:hypothetical protein